MTVPVLKVKTCTVKIALCSLKFGDIQRQVLFFTSKSTLYKNN